MTEIAQPLLNDLELAAKHLAQARNYPQQIQIKVAELAREAALEANSPSKAILLSHKAAIAALDRLDDLKQRASFEASLKGESRKASRDRRNIAVTAAQNAVEGAFAESKSDTEALDEAAIAATSVYDRQ